MPVEAVGVKFFKDSHKDTLTNAVEQMNKIFQRGEYLGHVVVSSPADDFNGRQVTPEGVVLIIKTPSAEERASFNA